MAFPLNTGGCTSSRTNVLKLYLRTRCLKSLPLKLPLALWGFEWTVLTTHNPLCQSQVENASHISHHCRVQLATQCRNLRTQSYVTYSSQGIPSGKWLADRFHPSTLEALAPLCITPMLPILTPFFCVHRSHNV